MLTFYLKIRQFMQDQTGAALAEYGLLVALIAVLCIGAVTALSTGVQGALTNAAGAL